MVVFLFVIISRTSRMQHGICECCGTSLRTYLTVMSFSEFNLLHIIIIFFLLSKIKFFIKAVADAHRYVNYHNRACSDLRTTASRHLTPIDHFDRDMDWVTKPTVSSPTCGCGKWFSYIAFRK